VDLWARAEEDDFRGNGTLFIFIGLFKKISWVKDQRAGEFHVLFPTNNQMEVASAYLDCNFLHNTSARKRIPHTHDLIKG
jgi:hypothetical protein